MLFLNRSFDKKRLKALLLWFRLNLSEGAALKAVEILQQLGFRSATQGAISLGLDDLKTPANKGGRVFQAQLEVALAHHEHYRGNRTPVELFQQLVDTWHRTSQDLTTEVVQLFHSTERVNPVYMMAFSGARGNISQVRQLVGMRGLMADPRGQIVGFPILSNFREGLTITEYFVSCYGARKGVVDTAIRTADAGYLTRRLADVSHHVVVRTTNCGTHRSIQLRDIKEGQKTILSLASRLVGRVLAEHIYIPQETNLSAQFGKPHTPHTFSTLPYVANTQHTYIPPKVAPPSLPSSCIPSVAMVAPVRSKMVRITSNVGTTEGNNTVNDGNENESSEIQEQFIVTYRNSEITPSLASKLAAHYNEVSVRSPLSCSLPWGVCQLCYGWGLSEGRRVTLGEAVGIIAAQSIGEPGTQLTLRTFHTGGVFSGELLTEIRSPYNGIVLFPNPLQGVLLRTPHGQIAFLTKVAGEMKVASFSPPKENIASQTSSAKLEVDKVEEQEFVIHPSTVIFVRQNEQVYQNQLLAEFSSSTLQSANDQIEITQQVLSETAGQIWFKKLDYGNRKGPGSGFLGTHFSSQNLGGIWVLAGAPRTTTLAFNDRRFFLVDQSKPHTYHIPSLPFTTSQFISSSIPRVWPNKMQYLYRPTMYHMYHSEAMAAGQYCQSLGLLPSRRVQDSKKIIRKEGIGYSDDNYLPHNPLISCKTPVINLRFDKNLFKYSYLLGYSRMMRSIKLKKAIEIQLNNSATFQHYHLTFASECEGTHTSRSGDNAYTSSSELYEAKSGANQINGLENTCWLAKKWKTDPGLLIEEPLFFNKKQIQGQLFWLPNSPKTSGLVSCTQTFSIDRTNTFSFTKSRIQPVPVITKLLEALDLNCRKFSVTINGILSNLHQNSTFEHLTKLRYQSDFLIHSFKKPIPLDPLKVTKNIDTSYTLYYKVNNIINKFSVYVNPWKISKNSLPPLPVSLTYTTKEGGSECIICTTPTKPMSTFGGTDNVNGDTIFLPPLEVRKKQKNVASHRQYSQHENGIYTEHNVRPPETLAKLQGNGRGFHFIPYGATLIVKQLGKVLQDTLSCKALPATKMVRDTSSKPCIPHKTQNQPFQKSLFITGPVKIVKRLYLAKQKNPKELKRFSKKVKGIKKELTCSLITLLTKGKLIVTKQKVQTLLTINPFCQTLALMNYPSQMQYTKENSNFDIFGVNKPKEPKEAKEEPSFINKFLGGFQPLETSSYSPQKGFYGSTFGDKPKGLKSGAYLSTAKPTKGMHNVCWVPGRLNGNVSLAFQPEMELKGNKITFVNQEEKGKRSKSVFPCKSIWLSVSIFNNQFPVFSKKVVTAVQQQVTNSLEKNEKHGFIKYARKKHRKKNENWLDQHVVHTINLPLVSFPYIIQQNEHHLVKFPSDTEFITFDSNSNAKKIGCCAFEKSSTYHQVSKTICLINTDLTPITPTYNESTPYYSNPGVTIQGNLLPVIRQSLWKDTFRNFIDATSTFFIKKESHHPSNNLSFTKLIHRLAWHTDSLQQLYPQRVCIPSACEAKKDTGLQTLPVLTIFDGKKQSRRVCKKVVCSTTIFLPPFLFAVPHCFASRKVNTVQQENGTHTYLSEAKYGNTQCKATRSNSKGNDSKHFRWNAACFAAEENIKRGNSVSNDSYHVSSKILTWYNKYQKKTSTGVLHFVKEIALGTMSDHSSIQLTTTIKNEKLRFEKGKVSCFTPERGNHNKFFQKEFTDWLMVPLNNTNEIKRLTNKIEIPEQKLFSETPFVPLVGKKGSTIFDSILFNEHFVQPRKTVLGVSDMYFVTSLPIRTIVNTQGRYTSSYVKMISNTPLNIK